MSRDFIKGAMRRVMAVALLVALMFAPLIIASTHGPGLPPVNSAEAAAEILHGHSHDEAVQGELAVGHDATDHEHQTQVVLPQAIDTSVDFNGSHIGTADVSAASMPSAGLRRPPKDLSA